MSSHRLDVNTMSFKWCMPAGLDHVYLKAKFQQEFLNILSLLPCACSG